VTSEESSTDVKKACSDIATEMLRVHEENYGAGASNVDVHLSGDIVVVILDVELTAAERTLLDAGQQDAVKTTRESFQQAIAPTFAAIIERAIGRKVRSFISAMSLEPVFSVELFRLEP
jgi:uncharacterized protein YbcI